MISYSGNYRGLAQVPFVDPVHYHAVLPSSHNQTLDTNDFIGPGMIVRNHCGINRDLSEPI